MTNLKKTLIAIIFASTTMSAYAQTKKETADAKKQLQEILKSNKQIEENLKKFDTLLTSSRFFRLFFIILIINLL